MDAILSRVRKFTAAGIIALGLLSTFAGAGPALAGIEKGETAFNKGEFLTAIREFHGPAYRGDALARYYLGVIYADGLGIDRSDEESLAWIMCAGKGAGLPTALAKDLKRKQTDVLSRISPYDLEQAQMRAATICGIASQVRPEPFAKEERNPDDIRPERGSWGTFFFFPGDTMVAGAAVVFHELGLTILEDILFGIARGFGNFLFAILSLIGWYMIGRIFRFFFDPIWRMVLARSALTHNAPRDEGVRGQTQESEQN